jgi:DNA-binding CsgD family transcriptional regulator
VARARHGGGSAAAAALRAAPRPSILPAVTVRARAAGSSPSSKTADRSTGSALFGRAPELEALTELLDQVAARGSALALHGGIGVGKSALLAAAGARAAQRGFLVLRTTGVESETQMPFAGLHQLLRPLLSEPIDLPAVQREALLAAFGSSSAVPDTFLVALGALNLLSDRAAHAPILLVADDVHWVDAPSCDVLAFIARRLQSDPIVLLAATRTGGESTLDRAELPELSVDPLDASAASALLDTHAPDLVAAVRERLLVEAAGNPLGLVELPQAWQERQGADAALISWLPLTERLERAFAARIGELPATTRAILLVAAVNDRGSLAEALHAATALTDAEPTLRDLAPAQRLVDVDGQELRFQHPLVRSAIRQSATVADRRAAHAALAALLADQPDRSVWHRAECTLGPDEDVAAELEAAAGRVQRRHGTALAVIALKRAAELSAAAPQRGARLLAAAELAFELGRYDAVPALLAAIEPAQLSTLHRRRMLWLEDFMAAASGAGTLQSMLTLTEQLMEEGDTKAALDALLTAATKRYWFDCDEPTRERLLATADRFAVTEHEPIRLMAYAMTADLERGALIIERATAITPEADVDPDLLRTCAMALNRVCEFKLGVRFNAAAVDGLRGQGRLALLGRALSTNALMFSALGELDRASSAAEESRALARETRQPRWVASAQLQIAVLTALRGEPDRARALIDEAQQALEPFESPGPLASVLVARARVAHAAGSPQQAFALFRRIFDPHDEGHYPGHGVRGLLDLAEAAVHTGHEREARAIVAAQRERAERIASPTLRMLVGQAEAVLAGDEQADALLQAALADPGASEYFRARLALAYGERLRRRQRVVEARTPLRAARDAFDALGVDPMSQRANQELRASGDTTRRHTRDAREELTPQELQIVELAAHGLTNREIGERLFLSHRTVGSHLYRAFPKLGISSRSELRARQRSAG